MKNVNALIAMALVSQNGNNPYVAFCEYIKYCIFVNTSNSMTLTEIRNAVSSEFGLYLPYNIAVKCLSQIEAEGVVVQEGHQIKRIGTFDIDAFERERTAYREKENSLIVALVQYVEKYGKTWDVEYAHEQLIKVLDKNGLAYDIFIHNQSRGGNDTQMEMEELLQDDEEGEIEVAEDEQMQPLFSDSLFVGKFIKQTLLTDSIQRDYLKSVCEGLMLCVGTYQLPDADAEMITSQIQGTEFFFDTKLLLRFVGCAGEAAVEAASELVSLIQSLGGRICYYPQTLEEMECAFEDAIRRLSNGYAPRDEEMRLYVARIKNSISVLQAKRASLQSELTNANIYARQHESFSDTARISYGFERTDLQQYMENHLRWDARTIENDAWSLWETHMRRCGNYIEYCGTKEHLPVFVTTNSRLIAVALRFREARPQLNGIKGWKQNRLPVITDIRLTCRLWSPAAQSERLSLLYLTANAVAAQRPTQRYLNTIRELAIELEETTPEYSGIPLPAFFEDNITDAILEHTRGAEENLNLGNFASTIAELSEWKAKEQEERTNKALAERNSVSGEFQAQTQAIIDGAVEENKDNLGMVGIVLRLILWWPAIATILFAGISSVVSYVSGNWHVLWIILFPVILAGAERLSSSKFVKKLLLKNVLTKAEGSFHNRVEKNLRKAELPYKDAIIQQVKEKTILWVKCKNMMEQ